MVNRESEKKILTRELATLLSAKKASVGEDATESHEDKWSKTESRQLDRIQEELRRSEKLIEKMLSEIVQMRGELHQWERHGFLPDRALSAVEMLPQLERILSPWLTRSPQRQKLLDTYLKPLIGEGRLWIEEGRVNVGFNYLQKFVNALFACMDEYHLSRFREHCVETATELRVFLEHIVTYKKGKSVLPLHAMVPIERAQKRLSTH